MGLKLIVDENEVVQNENISAGVLGTVVLIPLFMEVVKLNWMPLRMMLK
ncbi:hypothetical protein [Flagellimonas alvinocaridis]|nr:hypothetical protein [Allomuricauda alvinocaridis]